MKLKEVRILGIKYCEENNCNYTYIAHDATKEFYLTEKEDKHTVFIIKKNGSTVSLCTRSERLYKEQHFHTGTDRAGERGRT